MENKFEIRLIKNSDCEQVLEIYKPYVLSTAITFEYDVPGQDEFLTRIETNTKEYPWLVFLQNDKISGYAYGSRHRYKTAYQWSAESTIYLSADIHGKGIGRLLYETLFSLLRLQGYVNVYAGVAMPNEKSEMFHRASGFEEIGDFKKIGYKLGKWHDVKWFQLHLRNHIVDPPKPKLINEIISNPEYSRIIHMANQRALRLLS